MSVEEQEKHGFSFKNVPPRASSVMNQITRVLCQNVSSRPMSVVELEKHGSPIAVPVGKQEKHEFCSKIISPVVKNRHEVCFNNFSPRTMSATKQTLEFCVKHVLTKVMLVVKQRHEFCFKNVSPRAMSVVEQESASFILKMFHQEPCQLWNKNTNFVSKMFYQESVVQ